MLVFLQDCPIPLSFWAFSDGPSLQIALWYLCDLTHSQHPGISVINKHMTPEASSRVCRAFCEARVLESQWIARATSETHGDTNAPVYGVHLCYHPWCVGRGAWLVPSWHFEQEMDS
jgi:hypothetical protein